ncbi:MAG TPA: MFS transporter [Steroidobacteraceae bacterium]|jgi:sugar phosphate permease|nr:MFS transporter [Steroidobacteraceae bacterium]
MSNKPFYGWLIVAASALGICFGFVGTQIYAFSAFILPLSEEFGWKRGAISLGMTFVYITTTIALPLVGVLIDKTGVRRPLLVSTLLFGIILCLLYFLSRDIRTFYVGMIVLAALGSGTQSISYVRLIVAWFDRRKGVALALGVSGAGAAALILPPMISHIIQSSGWRQAFVTLGLINLVIVLPVLYFVVRNRPSDLGLQPDGGSAEPAAALRLAAANDSGHGYGEALRTGTFWKLAIATLLLGLALSGVISQVVPLIVDRGVARPHAGNLAALLGFSMILARLGAGYLLDRFHPPYVAAGLLLCPVLGLAGLAMVPGETSAALMLIALGIGMGLEFDALGFFCVHYFGRIALGRIYGTLFVLFNLGGAVGSYSAGHSYDLFSSYVNFLMAASATTLAAALLTAWLGPRSERAGSRPSQTA